jgi:hypothetical protein
VKAREKEAEKWTRRICPNIKKKMAKFLEWSNECFVLANVPNINRYFS